MTCEVHDKEINSQCAELLVRPLYIKSFKSCKIIIVKCYLKYGYNVEVLDTFYSMMIIVIY